MSPAETQEYQPPVARACQNKAFCFCSLEHMAAETTRVSLPVPDGEPGSRRLKFLAFRSETDLELGELYFFEPVMTVTVDTGSGEVATHEVLREEDPRLDEPVCYQKPVHVQDTYFEYVELLEEELFRLTEPLLAIWGRADLGDDEKTLARRWDELFRFLVNAPLFPYYTRLNPAFFNWLNTMAGHPELKPLKDMPEPDYDLPLPPQAAQDFPNAGLINLLKPEGDLPWVADDANLLVTLESLSLIPAPYSPLHGLQATPEERAEAINLLDWVSDEQRRGMLKDALRTLCNPTVEIEQAFTDSLIHLETGVFIDEKNPGENGEALWIRYTCNDEGFHEISCPLYPERMKAAMMSGLQADDVQHAQQIIHQFTMDEMAVLFALADLKLQKDEMPKEVDRVALNTIWDEKEGPGRAWWTEISRLISPVTLDKPPADHIHDGLEQLQRQGMIEQDGGQVRIGRQLQSILRGIEWPRACSALYIHHIINGETRETQGFSVIRTDTRLWVWEYASDYKLEEANGLVEVNFFQATGRQLGFLYDDFLNIPTEDAESREAARV